MILGEADNGASIVLPSGVMLQIVLPANPTTGYNWRVGKCSTAVLSLKEQHFEPTPQQLAGSGGQNYWSFRAVSPGTTDVRLELVRSWETVEPAQIYEVHVTVIKQ